jgi:hypothetical protein
MPKFDKDPCTIPIGIDKTRTFAVDKDQSATRAFQPFHFARDFSACFTNQALVRRQVEDREAGLLRRRPQRQPRKERE